jgi:hypothetical protein
VLLKLAVPFEAPMILRVWQVINLVAVGVTLAAYTATLRALRVSVAGRVLGVVLAFGAYAISKWPYFYPNMIDTLAVMLSSLYVYFYVKRRPLGVLLVHLVGLVAWPFLLPLIGITMLLLMPKQPFVFAETDGPGAPQREEEPRRPITGAGWAGTLFIAAALAWTAAQAIAIRAEPPVPAPGMPLIDSFDRFRHYDPLFMKELLPLSVAVLCLSSVLPTAELLRTTTLRGVLANLRVAWGGVAFAAWVAATQMLPAYANVRSYVPPALKMYLIQFALGIQRPMQPLVGHLGFFGIGTILLILFFRDFCRVARQLGPGYVAVLVLGFYLLLLSESRQEDPLLFIFLPVLVKAIDMRGVRWQLVAFTAVAALGTSKVWADVRSVDVTNWNEGSFLQFPMQHYFMHHGVAMGHLAFAGHAIAFGVLLAVGLWVVRRWAPASA